MIDDTQSVVDAVVAVVVGIVERTDDTVAVVVEARNEMDVIAAAVRTVGTVAVVAAVDSAVAAVDTAHTPAAIQTAAAVAGCQSAW